MSDDKLRKQQPKVKHIMLNPADQADYMLIRILQDCANWQRRN